MRRGRRLSAILVALAIIMAARLGPASAIEFPIAPSAGPAGVDAVTTLDAAPSEPLPEPGTLALLGSALAAIAAVMLIRKRRRK
jgi:hypothetical protein